MPGYAKPELFIFVVVAVSGVMGGWMAANRCRHFIGWCLLCAVFPPLLLVIYRLDPLCVVEGKFKLCHKCNMFIRWKDSVCRHCKSEQPPA